MQNVPPEQLAEFFHHYHQVLGPDLGCARDADVAAWDEMAPQERSRMIAAARLALLELETTSHEKDVQRYFARPGEAEWGC